ncbi:MAG: bifunctional [glutamine synthetase] adenylyltransferase/[glutamine synthetase]-adenylyl-L-tyrosine phosphorylase [Proteobacteria bacterium]|nr:bifunctional [glutamine synthetase] adenylyltransferase/[glutamine synthetase]-adenylyl-L-tyrosine phosphorylase [Pseudomonadota bacterium]
MQTDHFTLPPHWPTPYDEKAADLLLERVGEHDPDSGPFLNDAATLTMIRSLGGNSPYLADLAIRELPALQRLVVEGPQPVVAAALDALQAVPPNASRSDVATSLRRAKRIVALSTAIADIGGIWDLHRVTQALSDLAETALHLILRHLYRVAHDAGRLRLPDPDNPETGCGLVALAMGKLGAFELNYSSDVDLILIYDPDAPAFAELKPEGSVSRFTVRVAHDMVALMQDRDGGGYVFRTDLRLRPDPAATPPAISFDSAMTYYESLAQNWERAAMIKARPIAGDREVGQRFLEAMRPFVWRRGLDFAAIADIHAMKRRIDAKIGTRGSLNHQDPAEVLAGWDVKLGEGGIREIEFLVQTLQLVWGGRDPTMRVRPTFAATDALVAAGHLSEDTARDLKASYTFLRQVEHRLQMVNDRQTHSFPKSPAELERVALFLGYADLGALAASFLDCVGKVRGMYRTLFDRVPDLPVSEPSRPVLDFGPNQDGHGATAAALQAMGYTDAPHVVERVRAWLAGHVRALRSERARSLMTEMVPAILAMLSQQADPDETFRRFDRFITALPSGVQPMSLFQHNPFLLERVATVLGAAPRLAEHLARYPSALEGLIAHEDGRPALDILESRLGATIDLQDSIQIIRRTVMEKDFLLSVATLEGRLDADAVGRERSALADATLSVLLPRVVADFSARYGSVAGGDLAVVLLGKAGSQEMMAGSDLDLLLIYSHPSDVTESHGAKVLAASTWFVRAVHALVAALTAPGPEGQMFAVDMRLRPSGNKGPVAVSLDAFVRYHEQDSWTWERMALTRARVVAGPAALRERIGAIIQASIRRGDDPAKIRADAAAMRARMARELTPYGPWDVKLRPGGQVDVEFIAQALQLIYAPSHPEICHPTTSIALARLRDVGLLPEDDAAVLLQADRVWRTIQGILRLTVGQVATPALPPAPAALLLEAVARAGVEAVEIPQLLLTLDGIARQVRAIFVRHIGELGV